MLWGSNARETHPIYFHHVLKGIRRGARMVAVDPRRTSSAQWADLWLGLDVGTDVALANTVGREIIAAGLENRSFIDHATVGFEEYRRSVEPFTLERGEELTGVPRAAIRELAHRYATADRAQICWTLGITEHHNAVDNVLGLINLGLLTGHVGRYGSGLNPLRGQNNVQGGGDMGAIPNKLPGFQDVEDAALRARFESAWGATLPDRSGWHLSLMFEAMEHGDLKTLYVIGENPAQSEADATRARALLGGLGPPDRAGHPVYPHRADGRRGAAGGGHLGGGGRHGDQQRATRAAGAQGAGAAGPGARRHGDPVRPGATPRPRLGNADRAAGMG